MTFRPADADEMLGRGVWTLPFTVHGCRVLAAVDSRGEYVEVEMVRPEWDEALVIARLGRVLDQADPLRPALRIVKDDDVPPPPVYRTPPFSPAVLAGIVRARRMRVR